MTFTPEQDLAKHIRFIAEYDDGTTDVFAIPEATLMQRTLAIVPIIAGEWQDDGYLKPGTIVTVRGPKRYALN